MERPVRARRSRQRAGTVTRYASAIAAVLVLLLVVVAVVAVYRVATFVGSVTGSGITSIFAHEAPGSVAWKLHHGEQVRVLILGYGGSENDAPYLTDTIMAVVLDPKTHRVVEASIPRDLYGQIDAWPKGDPHYGHSDKINAAFMIGTQDTWGSKEPQFTGRDGGGHLAEYEVTKYTGISFDKYAGVDFKAFRDVVDALGGVDVCLKSPLDDYDYPDYHDHYIKGGIHFKAGCQHLNGERALELARSRKAIQPDQQTDFGRARRQQMLLSAIKKQALSVNGILKAPQLMQAVESDFKTDMSINDMRAIYDFTKDVPDNGIIHLALTDQNLLDVDTCGPSYLYTLCPIDPTLATMHQYFGSALVDPHVLAERAPVTIGNASFSYEDLGQRVSDTIAPLGFQVGPPVRLQPSDATVIYDFSGGRYPLTAQWLAGYFHAAVKPPPSGLPRQAGLLVVVGHRFALGWLGRTQ